MARCLPVFGAASILGAVLLATGCASGSPAHPSSKKHPLSLHAIADARKLEAAKTAQRLLAVVPLPAGARPVSRAIGDRAAHNINLGVNVFTQYAYRHAYWQVPSSPAAVLAFACHHPAPGFIVQFVGNGDTYPYQGVAYKGRSAPGHIPNRLLLAVVPQSRGTTLIQVYVGVVWTYPRSPHDMIPPGVREVDLHYVPDQYPVPTRLLRTRVTPVAVRVTDARKVALIVRWFNALNVVQPGTATVGCVVVAVTPMTYVFRAANGHEVAKASVPSTPASSCAEIQFTLDGKPQMPLIDSTPEDGMAFYERVQGLVGIHFLYAQAWHG